MASLTQTLTKIPPLRNALWRLATNSDVFHFLPTKLATYLADAVIEDPIDKAAYCMLANNTTTACQHLSNDKLQEIAAWLPIQLRASAYEVLAERQVPVPALTSKEKALLKKYRKPPMQVVDEHVTVDFLLVLLKAKTDDTERKNLLHTVTTSTLRELTKKISDASLQFCLGEIFFERSDKDHTAYDDAYACFLQSDHKDPRVETYCKEILKRQLQYTFKDNRYEQLRSLANKLAMLATPKYFKPQHLSAIRSLYNELYEIYKYSIEFVNKHIETFDKLLDQNGKELTDIYLNAWMTQRLAQGKDDQYTLAEIKASYQRLGLNFDKAKLGLLNTLDKKLEFSVNCPLMSPDEPQFMAEIYYALDLKDYYDTKLHEINLKKVVSLIGDRRNGRREDPEQNALTQWELNRALKFFLTPYEKLRALEDVFQFIKKGKDSNQKPLYTRESNWRWLFFKPLRTDTEVNQTFKDQMAVLKSDFKQIVRQALKDKNLEQRDKQEIIKIAKNSQLIDFNTSYYEHRRHMPTSSRVQLSRLLDSAEQSMRLSP